MLAILLTLLLAITAITCYYDCENRRSHLLGDKTAGIKMDTLPISAVKHEIKQSVSDKKKIEEDVRIYKLLTSQLTLQNIKQIIHRSYCILYTVTIVILHRTKFELIVVV